MPIEFKNNVFHIYNEKMSYCIELSKYNDLLHLYWGNKINADEISMPYKARAAFSAYEGDDGNYSLDVLPQEYPMYGAQDLRTPVCEMTLPNGNSIFKLRYKSHTVTSGKPSINGLPGTYIENDDEATTLNITLQDENGNVQVNLIYTVYESLNVICRRSEVKNLSAEYIYLDNAGSSSVDFHDCDYKYMHFHGAWARERHLEIADVKHGFQGIDSKRGASGVCENPFIAVMKKDATEDFGDIYGFSLVYSGNFKMSIEVEQYGTMRVITGINPHNFRFKLNKGEVFNTPETVLVYSPNGIGGMSMTYHELYRTRLCKGKYRDLPRPVLINNWEATYFNFNEEKLLAITEEAKDLGFELFVLDDGWFGKRNDGTSSLGDWDVNYEKLPDGIRGLADKVNKQGLMFGLWIEPEMISPDSDLYRKHPDWAIKVPNQMAHKGREQLILDLSRDEICNYVIDVFTKILSDANITYIKWDMNRNMTDMYSAALPYDRQGEVAHRYILGLYKIMDALTSKFPDILFEGCSGGGGRFDPGILYYMPQIWGSDDTDAVERVYIQYATSMVYPVMSLCSHVSDVPNHQVGRTTPMKLRGDVAMSGAMGFEFDLTKSNDELKGEIKEQITVYKRIREIIQSADNYRLINPFEDRSAAWMYVTKDKNKAVVFYFNKLAKPNSELRRIKLKGLDADKKYIVDGKQYTGRTLMNYGLYLPKNEKDFESVMWEIEAKIQVN